MMELNIKTIADIRALNPCYDPSRFAPEEWTGTALDVLKAEQVPAEDRLWIVCHDGWLDDRTLRLFAVWCARKSLSLIDNPDPRSVTACDISERYANGEATKEEFRTARGAALDAVVDEKRSDAWFAANDVLRSTLPYADMAAISVALRDADVDTLSCARVEEEVWYLVEMIEGE